MSDYCLRIFENVGIEKKDGKIVADSLVDADLRGVSSHGVMRVGNYLDRIENGGANPNPDIKIISKTPTTFLIDADDNLGAIVSVKACEMIRDKAKETGIAFGVVRRSNHHGACAFWSQKIAEEDMIGIVGTNVEPLLAVTGSRVRGIGNNPISITVPTETKGPVCLDISCSVMAGGKMLEFRREGKDVSEGSFLDIDGRPTTDSQKSKIMRPFGNHKGYGIAVMIEMLSSILAGGNYGSDMGSQYGILDKPNHISHFFMAIDIERFRDLEEFKKDSEGFTDYLENLPKAEGVERIYFPGQIENERKAKNLENGIPYTISALEEVESFGERVGMKESDSKFMWEQKA